MLGSEMNAPKLRRSRKDPVRKWVAVPRRFAHLTITRWKRLEVLATPVRPPATTVEQASNK